MVLRYFLKRFINNPYVIDRLADSRPIRSAAKFVAYLYQRSRVAAGEALETSDIKKRAERFTDTFTKELESELKKSKPGKK